MRIAVTHELPSGGAKRAMFETVRRLAGRHAVDIFTVNGAEHDFCDLRPFVNRYSVAPFEPPPMKFQPPFARLNFWQRRRMLGQLERIGRETAAGIDRGSYDVVYANPSRWTQAPALIQFLQTPSVYRVHDFRAVHEPPIRLEYPGSWRGWWSDALDALDPVRQSFGRKLREIDERNTRRATIALTDSRFAAANIAAIYGRVAIPVWCGADAERFRPLDRVGSSNEVISVGAIRAEKGFDFVIRALALMPPASRPRLRIAANEDFAPERARLIALALEVGVELHIELEVHPDRLVDRLNAAALFVYASIREPLGVSALEAMACALPVVSVEEGGVAESVLDGVTGRLVPRDERAFAAAVEALLADTDLRRRLGEQARRHVIENWSWDRSVRLVEEQLEIAAGSQ
jgi:glycosyltransferase involved in cell wall biosynthesis